jgi:hypothetical protein
MEKSFKILKLNEFIKENFGIKEHDGILIIVDVQKEFGNFIPKDLVKNLYEYCKEFDSVYQIWDSNDTSEPTFIFPNQVKAIKKKFGKNFLKKDVVEKLKKLTPEKKEGEIVILNNVDGQFVRINNNHKWFMVNHDLLNLFHLLKDKKVILVGGADHECLEDFKIAAKSFGVDIALNHKYIYSADTKQEYNQIL